MPNDDDGGPDALDDRVSRNEQISLTRRPRLSHELIREAYPHANSEQDAIRSSMSDVRDWAERGILPTDLLEKLREFGQLAKTIEATVEDGRVEFGCEDEDLTLVVEQNEDAESATVRLNIDDED